MKCINCGTDNKLKDRTANYGKCSKCGHAFVFEPTSMGDIKITDPMFAKVISDVSISKTLFFTPQQLFYLLDNRLKSKSFLKTGFVEYFTFAIVMIIVNNLFLGKFFSNILGSNSSLFVLVLYNICWLYYVFTQTKSRGLTQKNRDKSANNLKIFGFCILFIGSIFSLLYLKSLVLFIIVVCLGILSIYLGYSHSQITEQFLINQVDFVAWLNRWQQINGNITKILPEPQENTLQSATINPDVIAYSFDRLIVCDRAEIAQFLIANNFHFENNCAILSINGYPQSIFQTTMDMLRRNPDLKVYALHDCTSTGLGLVHHLRTSPDWFQNSNVAIIDIGITPRQVLATKKGIFLERSPQSASDAKQLTPEIRQELSPAEIKWLEAGNIVSLESFSPQKLIQVIQRGIANSQILGSDNDNLMIVGSSDNFIYATESFG